MSSSLSSALQVFARGQDGEHRGLTPGFLEGPQHQRLVRGRAPRHRGVLAGHVIYVDAPSFVVTIAMLVSHFMFLDPLQ